MCCVWGEGFPTGKIPKAALTVTATVVRLCSGMFCPKE